MKDTSVIEWYKDGKKIDPYDLHTPTVINPEYDDGTMSVAVDESTNGQPRYILHHNNSITIENVEILKCSNKETSGRRRNIKSPASLFSARCTRESKP